MKIRAGRISTSMSSTIRSGTDMRLLTFASLVTVSTVAGGRIGFGAALLCFGPVYLYGLLRDAR